MNNRHGSSCGLCFLSLLSLSSRLHCNLPSISMSHLFRQNKITQDASNHINPLNHGRFYHFSIGVDRFLDMKHISRSDFRVSYDEAFCPKH